MIKLALSWSGRREKNEGAVTGTRATGVSGIISRGIRLALCFGLVATGSTASAANRFIRAGATGANNGTDWANAYTSVPGNLVRGDVYYIAAGSYGNYTFNTAESGTTLSTLKKATVADHGTDTGWNATYANGQATFTGFTFNNGYLLVDGATKWGIKVTCGTPGRGIQVVRVGGASISKVTFQYVESAGPAGSAPYPYQVGGDCAPVYCTFFSGPTMNDLAFKNCYIHGASTVFQTAGTVRLLVENSILADSRIDYGPSGYDTSKPHDNIAFIQQGTDTTFRFNTVSNWDVTGFYPNGNSPGTHQIHGNYFQGGNRGAIWFYATIASNGRWLIHGNTFKDIGNEAIYHDSGAAPTGGATNNLFYNVGANAFNGLAHDFNWYSGSSKQSEVNGIAGGSASPFATVPSIVSTISTTSPRNKGRALTAENAIDMFGNARGADGAWDMGAVEYGTGGPVTNNQPPTVNSLNQNATDVDPILSGLQILEGTVVQYSGSASDPENNPLSWQWIYTINGGAEVVRSSGTGTIPAVTFAYSAGTAGQTYVWKLRVSDGTSTAEAQTTVTVQTPPTPLSGLVFDATAGSLSGPFTVQSGYIAQAAETSVTAGGRATYSFVLTNAGNYVIQALANAPDSGANSFFVNIDAEPQDPTGIWQIPLTSGFENRIVSWQGNGTWDNPQFVPKVFVLAAGTHQIIVRGREGNTQLSRLAIVKLLVPPSNLRVAGP